jgi:hypothetical protein
MATLEVCLAMTSHASVATLLTGNAPSAIGMA